MKLTLQRAPESKYKLFPVADELIPEGIKTITYKDEVFEIIDKYTFYKKEFFPTGLMNFVFGQEIRDLLVQVLRIIYQTYEFCSDLVFRSLLIVYCIACNHSSVDRDIIFYLVLLKFNMSQGDLSCCRLCGGRAKNAGRDPARCPGSHRHRTQAARC